MGKKRINHENTPGFGLPESTRAMHSSLAQYLPPMYRIDESKRTKNIVVWNTLLSLFPPRMASPEGNGGGEES
jgi:hypothetical protein